MSALSKLTTKCALDSMDCGTRNSQSNNLKIVLSSSQKNNSELFSESNSKPTKQDTLRKSPQNEMFKKADSQDHSFYIAKDIKKGAIWVKDYYSFEDASEFFNWDRTLPENEKNCYELIRDSLSCKPVFDIEWYGYKGDELYHHDDIYMMAEEYILAVFNELGINSTSLNITVLQSHRFGSKPKYSYHAIVNGVHLKNHHEYGKRLAELVIEKINANPDSPLHQCLDRNGKPMLLIDDTIYTRNRLIRLMGHHKEDEIDRALNPCEGRESFDLCDYLITKIGMDSKLLEIVLPEKKQVLRNKSEINYDKNYILSALNTINVEKMNRGGWLAVGIALKNELGEEGLDYFDVFSQKFDCYDYAEMVKDWNSFKGEFLHDEDKKTYSVGSIFYYARETNPSGYEIFLNEWKCEQQLKKYINPNEKDGDLENLIQNCLGLDRYHVAKLCHFFMRDQVMVCEGISKGTLLWYVFENHHWQERNHLITTFSIVNKLIKPVLGKYHIKLQENIRSEKGEEARRELETTSEKLFKLIKNLNDDNFIKSFNTNLATHLFKNNVYDKFDQNISLLGCTNGVYDLDKLEFREGQPEDLITCTTGLDYLTEDEEGIFTPNHPKVKIIEEFFQQIQPKKTRRKYLQTLLGSCLSGRNILELIYIFTGEGANGKSKLFELIDMALGKLSGSLKTTFFTGKQAQSHQATPEIAAIVNSRIVTVKEINKGESMHTDILKTFSGNDKITYRELHKPQKETIPKFTFIFAFNHLPKLPADDYAIWRRIRVIKFESKFTSDPDPQKTNERLKDPRLNVKLFKCRHAMLWLLIEWYKEFVEHGLKDIEDVLETTKEYKTSQDPIISWLDDNIEITNDDDYVQIKEVKQRLTQANLYKSKFKNDKTFIDFFIQQYPTCQYIANKKQIKGNRISNFVLGISFINKNTLDDEADDSICSLDPILV